MTGVPLPQPPRRALVLCFQRLGDVLLTTALIRSLRRAWPAAEIDALVFARTAQALEGNPDLSRVLAWPAGGGLGASWRATAALFRRYDVAFATLQTDRTHLTAWAAAPHRVGVVPVTGQGARWKRWLSDTWVEGNLHHTHVVAQYLSLAARAGVARHAELVPPRAADEGAIERALGRDWRRTPYAVVHPAAMFRYKSWAPDGWRALLRWLARQGLRVVVDAGPGADEGRYVDALVADLPGLAASVRRTDALRFPDLTPLLEGARLYVGPDTSVTHLAAACGVPTVALFGPMNPVTWGPWPRGQTELVASPWVFRSAWQHRGNVWLLQGIDHCVPCLQEGCERRPDSRADCLDFLPASRVIAAADQALRHQN